MRLRGRLGGERWPQALRARRTRPAVNVCCAEWLLGGERARGGAAAAAAES